MPSDISSDESIESPLFIDFSIKKSEVIRWLEVIYKLSGGTDNLQNAITLAKHLASTEEEHEIANGMGLIYRAQCSGALIPPVKLTTLYGEIRRRETS